MKFKPNYDIGYGLKVPKTIDRIVDKDGHFQISHSNRPFQFRDIYHYLIHISWSRFFLIIVMGYFIFNFLFGILYMLGNSEQIIGLKSGHFIDLFLQVFYFSSQTFTTLGFGNMAPVGHWASMLAVIEAMIGLLYFSFATSLFYGRFSRATPNLKFTNRIYFKNYEQEKALNVSHYAQTP